MEFSLLARNIFVKVLFSDYGVNNLDVAQTQNDRGGDGGVENELQ